MCTHRPSVSKQLAKVRGDKGTSHGGGRLPCPRASTGEGRPRGLDISKAPKGRIIIKNDLAGQEAILCSISASLVFWLGDRSRGEGRVFSVNSMRTFAQVYCPPSGRCQGAEGPGQGAIVARAGFGLLPLPRSYRLPWISLSSIFSRAEINESLNRSQYCCLIAGTN